MSALPIILTYVAFVSFGLPDSVFGAAWPAMYPAFGVPVSYAGIVSAIIAASTILSNLTADRLARWLGTGRLTVLSVALTAAALFGFSLSPSFLWLCFWAVPYGLGAGGVDTALNNYAALRFSSRHMSWLHCMWGVGAAFGPWVMGAALTSGQSWNGGYLYLGIVQTCICLALLPFFRVWDRDAGPRAREPAVSLSLPRAFRIPGVAAGALAFFAHTACEASAGFWAASYLTLAKGMSADAAAGFSALFYIGVTAGRGLCGLVCAKMSDRGVARLARVAMGGGLALLLLPAGEFWTLSGLALLGLGCGPVFPSMVHLTPALFGASRSQSIVGVELAFANVGAAAMPPLLGALMQVAGAAVYPWCLAVFLGLSILAFRLLLRRAAPEGA